MNRILMIIKKVKKGNGSKKEREMEGEGKGKGEGEGEENREGKGEMKITSPVLNAAGFKPAIISHTYLNLSSLSSTRLL